MLSNKRVKATAYLVEIERIEFDSYSDSSDQDSKEDNRHGNSHGLHVGEFAIGEGDGEMPVSLTQLVATGVRSRFISRSSKTKNASVSDDVRLSRKDDAILSTASIK